MSGAQVVAEAHTSNEVFTLAASQDSASLTKPVKIMA